MDSGRSKDKNKQDVLNLAIKIFEVGKMDPKSPARELTTKLLT